MNSIQFTTPIGLINVFSTGKGIAHIDIDRPGGAALLNPFPNELLQMCELQIGEYLDGKRAAFDLPLDWDDIQGFQADVLRYTLSIPFGEIRTYGEIARVLQKPAASRAVGGALARNPLPLLIPCHRVVAASGQLTGYSAADGIITKAWLLEKEGHRVVAQKLG